MQMGHSKKLCISFCLEKFQTWPRFHIQAIISQLLRKPFLKIFGVGLVLCQIKN